MQSAILLHQLIPSVRPSVRLSACLSVRQSRCDTLSIDAHVVKLIPVKAITVTILFFLKLTTVTKFQTEPLSVSVKHTTMRKVCDFRPKTPFISKTVRDRAMVTDIVDR